MACVYALLSIGFDLLAHIVGLVSLGGAFFIGVGGYLAAILNTYFGVPLVLTIPIATLAGALICTVLLVPVLPLRGVYFAIATLMYPLIFTRLIAAFNIFGGTDGIVGVSSFPNPWIERYLIIIMLIVVLFSIRRLVNEDYGLVMRGVKDNDQAVKASGISIRSVKAVAVFITPILPTSTCGRVYHSLPWIFLLSPLPPQLSEGVVPWLALSWVPSYWYPSMNCCVNWAVLGLRFIALSW
jgi:branched-chain amino acid transport system permease protein